MLLARMVGRPRSRSFSRYSCILGAKTFIQVGNPQSSFNALTIGRDPVPPSLIDDFFIGANSAAGRAAADRIIEEMPDICDAAWANRRFLAGAARIPRPLTPAAPAGSTWRSHARPARC